MVCVLLDAPDEGKDIRNYRSGRWLISTVVKAAAKTQSWAEASNDPIQPLL